MNDIAFKGFKPITVSFLQELSENNNRNWFMQNKKRYETDVLTPALNYISAMSESLAKFSPNFVAVPKRIGGSLMRIYRDTRFSKDKTPYKTNIGIHFRHRLGKDMHAPGYYVHIAPDELFLGVGIWHPPSDALLKIREYIDEHPKKWINARNDKAFRNEYEIMGDKLKLAPRGFPKDHKLIEDLKWKDHTAIHRLSVPEIQKDNFVEWSADIFRKASPYMKFLCDALGVPF